MATISTSAVTTEAAQKDGRFWAHERHTDTIGFIWTFDYLANAGTNTATILAARAITLAADLIAQEIANNIVQVETFGSLATVTTNYSTLASQAPFLRAAYAGMTQAQAIMTGDYLSTFSNAALQNAFNLTSAQVTTLRTNFLTPDANAAATIRAAVGT